jgi:hypothetical protein
MSWSKMRFKFVVNTEDHTLRCIYDDKLIKVLKDVGEILSIKRISDIEPNALWGWTIHYRAPYWLPGNAGFRSRQEALDYEHDVVETQIIELVECKKYLGKAD